MAIADGILPEFDQEMAATRGVLAAIPEDQWSWKPHDKSYPLGDLANHVAQLPAWGPLTLGASEFDIDPEGGMEPPPIATNVADLLAKFDKNAAAARQSIADASDEKFFESWTMKKRGEALFTAPKIGVLRRFVLNHGIHHRGQLTVYLRLLDAPVPQTFGPTADFPEMG